MANRADQRKFHYIYKITRNDGSGKYYIGMHSTDDLEDGYFGSGKLLWHSINRHGKEKRSMEILEFLPSRAKLKLREGQIVNEEILDDPLCMNLKLGGQGGWDHLNTPEAVEKRRYSFTKWSSAGRDAQRRLMQEDEEYRSKRMIKIREVAKLGNAAAMAANPEGTFGGRSHSEETKQKMRKPKNVGESNSQFGTCWVSNEVKPIKIKKEELEEYLANGYRRGRK